MNGGSTHVASLLAKEAIREALFAELEAWRRRDWDAMRAGFVSDARIEGALFDGPFDPHGFRRDGAQAERGGARERTLVPLAVEAALERLAESMRRHARSSLLASNCRVEIAEPGTRARLSALILAAHEPLAERGERTRLETLRLEDDWVLDGSDSTLGQWKVATRRVETLWRAWLDPRRDDPSGDHRNAKDWMR